LGNNRLCRCLSLNSQAGSSQNITKFEKNSEQPPDAEAKSQEAAADSQ